MTNTTTGQWPKSKTVISEITKSVFEHLKQLTDEELMEMEREVNEMNTTNCAGDSFYVKQGLGRCIKFQLECNKYAEAK